MEQGWQLNSLCDAREIRKRILHISIDSFTYSHEIGISTGTTWLLRRISLVSVYCEAQTRTGKEAFRDITRGSFRIKKQYWVGGESTSYFSVMASTSLNVFFKWGKCWCLWPACALVLWKWYWVQECTVTTRITDNHSYRLYVNHIRKVGETTCTYFASTILGR